MSGVASRKNKGVALSDSTAQSASLTTCLLPNWRCPQTHQLEKSSRAMVAEIQSCAECPRGSSPVFIAHLCRNHSLVCEAHGAEKTAVLVVARFSKLCDTISVSNLTQQFFSGHIDVSRMPTCRAKGTCESHDMRERKNLDREKKREKRRRSIILDSRLKKINTNAIQVAHSELLRKQRPGAT